MPSGTRDATEIATYPIIIAAAIGMGVIFNGEANAEHVILGGLTTVVFFCGLYAAFSRWTNRVSSSMDRGSDDPETCRDREPFGLMARHWRS